MATSGICMLISGSLIFLLYVFLSKKNLSVA